VQIFLVGTKSDLKARRTVSAEMIKAYSEANGLTYLETSSKTNENVEKCFVDFTRKLVEHTNEMKVLPKDPSIVGIHGTRKPVPQPKPGGCYGGNKCTI